MFQLQKILIILFTLFIFISCGSENVEEAPCPADKKEIEADICVSKGIASEVVVNNCEDGSGSTSIGAYCESKLVCDIDTIAFRCEKKGSGYFCKCLFNDISQFEFFSENICGDITKELRDQIARENCNWSIGI